MKRILLTTVSAFILAGSANADPILEPPSEFADPQVIVEAASAPTETILFSEPEKQGPPELTGEQKAFAGILGKGSFQGVPLDDPQGIRDFYKERHYDPVWIKDGKITKNAKKAIEVLEDSWTHGMSPLSYHASLLRDMSDIKLTESQLADFEILLSNAVAKYGHDITGIRVDPKALGEDTKSWAQGVDARQILHYVATPDDAEKAMQNLAPGGKLYEKLRTELKKLIEDIRERPDADPVPLKYTKAIYPGERDPAIAQIRERLGYDPRDGNLNELYDDGLAQAIGRFQRANGLKPDGIIGKRTYAALNQGRQDKLIKIIANLERQRWLDQRFPERYIVVNIPAMTLWAIEDGNIKYEMPVVVGREKRPTNSFITKITGIRFNPSWNVPDTIKTEDFLPALQKDPEALKKKGIELIRYTSDGYETIPPETIDWAVMTPKTIKAIGMVQLPGDDNALGRIRVLMPNKYDIYLHDTNSPDLFTKDFRALSSGCIRVAEPYKVAEFILGHNKGWNDKKITGYLEKAKTVEVRAETTLPVFILYQTVWLDEEGDIVYGDDLYARDVKLVKELQRSGQLSIPVNFK